MGGKENVEKGKRWVERAMILRKQILPGEHIEPQTADFDVLVCFWSI